MRTNKLENILLAHACCSFTNTNSKICELCPFNNKEECEKTSFSEDAMISVIKEFRRKEVKPMKRINLEEIIVPEEFLNSKPNEDKLKECREVWNKYKIQDRYLVINKDKKLIDGYVQYLVLKENNITKNIEVRVSNISKKSFARKDLSYLHDNGYFVFGYHPNDVSKKEFCWKIPENRIDWSKNLKEGDMIFCETKFSDKCPVIVTRVLDNIGDEISFPTRKISNKKIIRNGEKEK